MRSASPVLQLGSFRKNQMAPGHKLITPGRAGSWTLVPKRQHHTTRLFTLAQHKFDPFSQNCLSEALLKQDDGKSECTSNISIIHSISVKLFSPQIFEINPFSHALLPQSIDSLLNQKRPVASRTF